MSTNRQLAGQLTVELTGDCAGGESRRTDAIGRDDSRLAGLMRSSQIGDAAAYAQLLGQVTPLVRQAVRRRYPFLQPSDIEDIIQEILLSLHAARATYDPDRPFLPWLMAIARNRMVDAARRHIRRAAHETTVEHLPETFSERETNTAMDSYGDPEALRQAIRGLPTGQRQAVELLKLREMSLKEAAAVTGMSIGALKVAVHRAVRSLRTVLSNEA